MLLAKPVGLGHIKEHGRNILPAFHGCIMKTVLNVICFDFHLTQGSSFIFACSASSIARGGVLLSFACKIVDITEQFSLC